jgi:DNA-binding transcriptional MerR regulator/methylmalonyl-CoA mutase cobalamin-binding subunit
MIVAEHPAPNSRDQQHEMDDSATGGMLSIGALARATSIRVETLRTWERRYGYPIPERKPSGHRVYPVASVSRLRRIAQALASGHRASEVVSASESALRALLDTVPARPLPELVSSEGVQLADHLDAVRAFDAPTLTRRLLAEWARLGPLEFLTTTVAPLVSAVGACWEAGTLEVSHEHFLSERVSDVLRVLRLPFEERARGPLIVLASLPGEQHSLGLHMAALILATSHCRSVVLGTEVPTREIAGVARDLSARAVGISVSVATGGGPTSRKLRTLRALLPRRIGLLVGGEGARRSDRGVTLVRGLPALEMWARQVAGGTT